RIETAARLGLPSVHPRALRSVSRTSDEQSFSAERNFAVSEQKSRTWISDWRPEDETFWNSTGKFVARRNLIWSSVAENIAFWVWLIWSIVATKLPAAGFHFTTDQLFQLVAIPGLIGSPVRLPSTVAVAAFRGRNS